MQLKPISYLACPYSDPDAHVKEMRYQLATLMTYYLMQKGKLVYSPLTHNVPVDKLGIHGDWEIWKEFDHGMLSRCNQLLILKLPGWEASKGVKAERLRAEELGLPIEELDLPDTVYEMYRKIAK
jgi:hypothetical protein